VEQEDRQRELTKEHSDGFAMTIGALRIGKPGAPQIEMQASAESGDGGGDG
jgi:hypothetical protein